MNALSIRMPLPFATHGCVANVMKPVLAHIIRAVGMFGCRHPAKTGKCLRVGLNPMVSVTPRGSTGPAAPRLAYITSYLGVVGARAIRAPRLAVVFRYISLRHLRRIRISPSHAGLSRKSRPLQPQSGSRRRPRGGRRRLQGRTSRGHARNGGKYLFQIYWPTCVGRGSRTMRPRGA